jgi:hypothetical protein
MKYTYDGGMTMLRDEKKFKAYNDTEALEQAREIAGDNSFELEQFRPIKNR